MLLEDPIADRLAALDARFGPPTSPGPDAGETGRWVRCASCGRAIPVAGSFRLDDAYYCAICPAEPARPGAPAVP